LPLENATGADAGSYVVQVSNAEGNATSQTITVTVKMPVVPTGVYRINNSEGATGHEVAVTAFSIDQHEVTKAFWDEVYTWAVANGYDFSNPGIAEGPEYPVHSVNWYDAVKWSNALSERDGHVPCYYTDDNCTVPYKAGQVDLTNYNVKWNADGYRLPTETEWEVASRGGLVGSKYAWGESPSTTKANFDQTLHGATVPVGSFPATGYGLYEIGGNLREWTWDWNDTVTYAYEFREVFTVSGAGILGLVNTTDTNATWGWAAPDSTQHSYSSETTSSIRSSYDFPNPIYIYELKNELYAHATVKIKFLYTDETVAFSQEIYNGNASWTYRTYDNPKPTLLVKRIELWGKSNGSNTARDRNLHIGKTFSAPTNGSVVSITLDLNQYDSNSTHFKVNSNLLREGDDDIWFELVDGNGTRTYANADFNKLLPMPAEVRHPKKLRIYLKAKSSSPTAGGTAVRDVFWTTSDPKSHWTGTQRVIRDNHYAEGLKTLSKRSFSTPDKRYSTVGFRLVQRP
jgi:formylglycine-generating enzyme required for sulfatase activity